MFGVWGESLCTARGGVGGGEIDGEVFLFPFDGLAARNGDDPAFVATKTYLYCLGPIMRLPSFVGGKKLAGVCVCVCVCV